MDTKEEKKRKELLEFVIRQKESSLQKKYNGLTIYAAFGILYVLIQNIQKIDFSELSSNVVITTYFSFFCMISISTLVIISISSLTNNPKLINQILKVGYEFFPWHYILLLGLFPLFSLLHSDFSYRIGGVIGMYYLFLGIIIGLLYKVDFFLKKENINNVYMLVSFQSSMTAISYFNFKQEEANKLLYDVSFVIDLIGVFFVIIMILNILLYVKPTIEQLNLLEKRIILDKITTDEIIDEINK